MNLTTANIFLSGLNLGFVFLNLATEHYVLASICLFASLLSGFVGFRGDTTKEENNDS